MKSLLIGSILFLFGSVLLLSGNANANITSTNFTYTTHTDIFSDTVTSGTFNDENLIACGSELELIDTFDELSIAPGIFGMTSLK